MNEHSERPIEHAADDIEIRRAHPADVRAISDFGAEVIPPHYTPLIGADAAQAQLTRWWSANALHASATEGNILLALIRGRVTGVVERGRLGADHVIYKLYLASSSRGHGLGPRLIDAVIGALPPGVDRLWVEHFAGNERAGAFYERESFHVDRIEPSSSGDPAKNVVWRVRDLRPPRR